MLSLLTALKFLLIDLHACLHVPRHGLVQTPKHSKISDWNYTPRNSVVDFKGLGRTASEKFITEHCGLLNKLLLKDFVLADRGFDIEDSVGLYAARLQIPSFTKGKPQLSSLAYV